MTHSIEPPSAEIEEEVVITETWEDGQLCPDCGSTIPAHHHVCKFCGEKIDSVINPYKPGG